MIFEHWATYAFICSFLFAATSLWIQYFSISTKQALVWRGIGAGAIMTPVLFFYDAPTDWEFYAILGLISTMAIYGDFRIYEINRTYGAGLKNRISPLVVFLTFILSFMVEYDQIHLYLEKPLITIGILLSLFLCLLCGFNLKDCSVSKKAYAYAIPTIVIYSVCNLLAKEALTYADNPNGSLYYAALQGWYIGGMALLFVNNKPSQDHEVAKTVKDYLSSKQGIIFGSVLGVIIAAAMVTRNVSYFMVDNVSYPVAIQLLVPFWVSLFYLCIGHKEETSILPGLGIVVSAIALVLLTGHIH